MKRARSRRGIHWAIKQAIWRSACAVCGSKKNVQIDHIIPRAKGGGNGTDNLQPLCGYCNCLKGCRLDNEGLRVELRLRGVAC